jgi:DNA-binding transcriptional MerR regulator
MQYTIQMAAKISGVGVHTIRAWEKRYKAIVPDRDIAGHRVYSKDDIEKLILLSELCLLGYSISKIASQSVAELKEQLKALGKSDDSIKNLEMSLYQDDHVVIDYSQSMTIILMALKAYKLDIVSSEINKLKLIMNSREFALEVIQPIMSELGSAVTRGDYTISHEHALSSLLKFHTGHLLYKLTEAKERHHINILICGVEGDLHEFGILMAALLSLHYQYNITYLGPSLPADSLIDTIRFLDAKIVVVGATSIVSSFGKNYLGHYLEKVASQCSNVELVIGSSVAFEIRSEFKKRLKIIQTMAEFDQFLANYY